jgi:L-seryl-tRNA(Ser) seleniumtransferase
MSIDNRQEMLRNIPQVEKLLQREELSPFPGILGHGITVRVLRSVTDSFREKALAGEEIDPEAIVTEAVAACIRKGDEKLRRVINCSGIIIHTNLGRSPLGEEILKRAAESLSGYCNLEFHLPSQKRGKRGGFAEELICDLTGAEDALIVNNNASSVFLVLNEFGKGREVIVSRGELIQMGEASVSPT